MTSAGARAISESLPHHYSYDCQSAVSAALHVKRHLHTFRHRVYGESYSTGSKTLEEKKYEDLKTGTLSNLQ